MRSGTFLTELCSRPDVTQFVVPAGDDDKLSQSSEFGTLGSISEERGGPERSPAPMIGDLFGGREQARESFVVNRSTVAFSNAPECESDVWSEPTRARRDRRCQSTDPIRTLLGDQFFVAVRIRMSRSSSLSSMALADASAAML